MTVTPTTATNSAASSHSSSSSSSTTDNTLNYNNFLQLLVAQLQNQDPTNPSDPTTFVSQLASFSSVEQQVNTNSKLDALLAENALSQGVSVIGATVTSADGTVSGQVASVTINSTGATAVLTSGQTITLGTGVKIS